MCTFSIQVHLNYLYVCRYCACSYYPFLPYLSLPLPPLLPPSPPLPPPPPPPPPPLPLPPPPPPVVYQVRDKMLYAATKATVKRAFQSGVVIDDIAATTKVSACSIH